MQHVGISPGRQKCSQLAVTSLASRKEASMTAAAAEKNFMLIEVKMRFSGLCRPFMLNSSAFYH